MKALTLTEVKKRIKGLDKDRQRSTVCALVGHSLVVTGCFGYVYCGRCGAQVGDQLGGIYGNAEKSVRIGHNCDTCRKNYAGLDWRHKFLTPDPFIVE